MWAGRARAIRYPDAALFVIPNAAKRGILGAMLAAQRAPIYGYMLTNRIRTLYVGVTNDLERRMYEHKHKLVPGFTSRYNVTWLAYYEQTPDVASANSEGEADQGLAPQQEGRAHRVVEPAMGGPVAGVATRRRAGVLDSSLRSEFIMRVATLTTVDESGVGFSVVTGLMAGAGDGFPLPYRGTGQASRERRVGVWPPSIFVAMTRGDRDEWVGTAAMQDREVRWGSCLWGGDLSLGEAT